MITMSAVPTRTPIPIVATNRNRDWDRAKVNGREPARKELQLTSAFVFPDLPTETHAMAIMVLRVTSIKRPSNILTEFPFGSPFFFKGCQRRWSLKYH